MFDEQLIDSKCLVQFVQQSQVPAWSYPTGVSHVNRTTKPSDRIQRCATYDPDLERYVKR